MKKALFAAIACTVSCLGQEALGPPRWMPDEPMQGPRTADALATGKQIGAFINLIKASPVLNPPPGVYPKASSSFEAQPAGPHQSSMLVGFWPPKDVRISNGRLRTAGELSHLLIYFNSARTDSLSQNVWRDDQGLLYTMPEKVGELQGFPIYRGFGGNEVSGIVFVHRPNVRPFLPLSNERFYRYAIGAREKELASGQSYIDGKKKDYEYYLSAEAKAKREARIQESMASYQRRPRTPEEMKSREAGVRASYAAEEEALRLLTTPEGNPVYAAASKELARLRAALGALTAAEKAAQACHLPDARIMGPHPVPTGTPNCLPMVAVNANWYDPKLPRTAWQMVTIERYWPSKKEAERGEPRSERNIYHYLNKEVTESIDWKAVVEKFLQ